MRRSAASGFILGVIGLKITGDAPLEYVYVVAPDVES